MTEEQAIQTAADMNSAIRKEYNGIVPLQELAVMMSKSTKEELQALVLLSCNQCGTLLKGGDYKDGTEGLWYVNESAAKLLDSNARVVAAHA